MPSPPTLDIAEILAPIPGENPAGQSVRYDGTYDALREARRADDPQMSQGEWVREIKVADWPAVITQATEVGRQEQGSPGGCLAPRSSR